MILFKNLRKLNRSLKENLLNIRESNTIYKTVSTVEEFLFSRDFFQVDCTFHPETDSFFWTFYGDDKIYTVIEKRENIE